MTVQTMSGSHRRSSSFKGRSQELDWDAIEDPDCVVEPGWQDEPKTPWTCTTCKAYVKMKHLAKLWPRSQVVIYVPQWEGPTKSCMSDHFKQRYFEIHTAAGLPYSKLKMMNYSNMAMVWAEIVLHKDVDWRTIYGRNVSGLNRDLWMIPTNWIGPSDCWPRWSNRISNSGSYGLLQLLDSTNIQAMARNTIRIGPSPTTLPRHSARRMKGEAMDMITIHTTALGTTPPQHSVFHTKI
jgi:hypothetical protein